MDIEFSTKEDDIKKNEIIRVDCGGTCPGKTQHKILQSIKQDWEERGGYGIDGFVRYQIIHCEGCETISFRQESYFSEEDYDGGALPETLYPERIKHESIATVERCDVPDSIKGIYKETIDAFCADFYILCAIGIRSVLEAICDEQEQMLGCEGYDLYKKIANLTKHNVITKSNSDILHQLRFLGNEAVHERLKPEKIELESALEIINHMIESLYVMPKKIKQIKTRQHKNKRVSNKNKLKANSKTRKTIK